MAIAPVPAFPFPRRPFSSITPFTYSDAMTHLELLEKLRVYAGVTLPDEINKVLDEYSVEITAEVQAAIDLMIGTLNDKIIEIDEALALQQADYTQKISDLTVYVDDAVQQIINNAIEVQDPVVAGMVGDDASQTRGALNTYLDVSVPPLMNDEFRTGDSPAIESGELLYGARPVTAITSGRVIQNTGSSNLSLPGIDMPLMAGTLYDVTLNVFVKTTLGSDNIPDGKIIVNADRPSSIVGAFHLEGDATTYTFGDAIPLATLPTTARALSYRITGTIRTPAFGARITVNAGAAVSRNSTIEYLPETTFKAEPITRAPLPDGAGINFGGGSGWLTNTPGKPWSITEAEDNHVRIEVRRGDRRTGDEYQFPGDNRERCELVHSTRQPTGEIWWRAFDFRFFGNEILPEVGGSSGGYLFLSQAVQSGDGSVFNVSIGNESQGTKAGMLAISSTSEANGYYRHWTATERLVEGQIYRVLMRLNFDPTNGSVEVWLDGEKIVNDLNMPVGFPAAGAVNRPSFKFGQYSSRRVDTLVTEFANIAYTRDDLSSRVANPLPWPSRWA